nr:immunoglobulin heavy chain junction region [Macaca mulatta]MOW99167.1 immunoglobulin heavy chain junction region [Macaca mulatta]MOW99631.1 immunoglobulin heavy chain junction region [Macaca mulatta]MOW99726.1 immunoglobulin heavy chain junction region [Macaca mulatta]MOX00400.1 immunoglobulin heavy chain junction region [Macaca mulatta]
CARVRGIIITYFDYW